MWRIANSNIHTKAADKTLELSNLNKSPKIHKKNHRFHGSRRFSRKKANFTENVTAVKSWFRLVPSYVRRVSMTVSGVNMPDHAAMFQSLHKLLVKTVTPHVVSLNSSKCQTLKSAILNIALQLVPSLSSQVSWFVFLYCFHGLEVMVTHLENLEKSGNLTLVRKKARKLCHCICSSPRINITWVLLSKVDMHNMDYQ